jgi:hypothetical protein
MKTTQTYTSLLPEFLKSAMNKHIELAIEEEIEEAKKRIDKRKSEIIAGVILHVQRQVEYETLGDRLIITVKDDRN